jgi:esterase/lipase
MNTLRFASCLVVSFVLLISACAPATPNLQEQEPSPTSELIPVTPVESAIAPGNPTAAPLDDILESHTVTFETPDGASLTGELYGSGETAVIFSVMGSCKQGWRELAQQTAAQGLMALIYEWRDCSGPGQVDETALSRNFLNDTRGAIDFVREQGASEIILAGASLGGLASAKLAIESEASGLIVFASPVGISRWDFEIEAADLDTDIPKLFLIADKDTVVPLASARALYDLAAEPREWQTYPGFEHGTDLLEREHGEDAAQRILEFILTVAPEN